jgi:hypothetical protein
MMLMIRTAAWRYSSAVTYASSEQKAKYIFIALPYYQTACCTKPSAGKSSLSHFVKT